MRVYRDFYTYHCISSELEDKTNVSMKRCYRYVTRMPDHFIISPHPSRKVTSRFLICPRFAKYLCNCFAINIYVCTGIPSRVGRRKSIFLPINKRRNSPVCINNNVISVLSIIMTHWHIGERKIWKKLVYANGYTCTEIESMSSYFA